MKLSHALMLVAALLLAPGMFPAMSSQPAGVESHKMLPVLVTVDRKGEVTEVAPAYDLRPGFRHSISDMVKKMITKPAMKHGKAVRSQLVMTFALIPQAGHDGKSRVSLKYLKSQALPLDTWHWVHMTDNKLALENDKQQFMAPAMEAPPPLPSAR